MKNKLLLSILFIEIIIYLIVKPEFNNKYSYLNIDNDNLDVNSIKLENYVIGVVAAEMPASFSFDALKAQAVAARTFAYNKIINSNLSYDDIYSDKGQSYISKDEMRNKWKDKYDDFYQKITKAVLETKGEIITYNDEIITPYYFSTSNGLTENSASVFGEKPYLLSVDSSWDKDDKDYEVNKSIPVDEFKRKLNIVNNDIVINNIIKNNTNHVEKIIINGKEYSGIEFRKKLNLRSTDFEIIINNNLVNIKTKGYGHGVGMSQTGANYLSKKGKSYIDILKYYYKDINITKI